ncbi:HET-domain-containing protein [Sarocladium strictum]
MPRLGELLPGEYSRRQGDQKRKLHDDVLEASFARMSTGELVGHTLLLTDNSFTGSRQWNESLLFVPCSPLTIRTPRHFWVEVEDDLQDGPCIYIHRSKQDEGGEAEHNAIQLRSSHELCTACKDVFNYYAKFAAANRAFRPGKEGGAPLLQNNAIHHASLTSLYYSGRIEKCFICSQITDKIDKLYPNLAVELWPDYQVECCWTVEASSETEQRMWFVMFDPSVPRWPMRNYKHMLRIGLWSKSTFGSHFDKELHRSEAARFHGLGYHPCADEETTNDHSNTRALAQAWYSACRENTGGLHELCNRRDADYLPSRLLDVRYALKSGNVRIVVPSEQPAAFSGSSEYASLSHCWGSWGSKEPSLLLSNNVQSRISEGIDLKGLPKTFQDAFKIASWFGIEWLWIDSLCIVQDSKEDWQREASTMDKVYMNAEINISADIGEDGRAGCFATRTELDTAPLEISATEMDLTWLITTENTFSWMRTAPSLSRAWIHRERQLSRRILHFAEKELVWECCGLGKACFASETMPGGSPSKRVFNDQTKFQNQLAQLAAAVGGDGTQEDKDEQRDKFHQLWTSTCQELSSKSITVPEDLPVILSSLAREFHQRMAPTDEYVCGLWRSTIPESLAWCVPGVKAEGLGCIAPTWSWLSTGTAVELHEQSRHRNRRKAAAVLDIHLCKPPGTAQDPYGPVTSGTLRMRGFLRRLHIHFTSVGQVGGGIIVSVVEHDQDGRDRLRLIGNDWNEDEGQVFRFGNEDTIYLHDRNLECWAFFTSFGEWGQDLSSCSRSLDCILLEERPDNDGSAHIRGQTYKRIGILSHISDHLAFRLRYRVAPDATGPEAGVLRAQRVSNPNMYSGPPKPEKWTYKDQKNETNEEEIPGQATDDQASAQIQTHEQENSLTLPLGTGAANVAEDIEGEKHSLQDIWTMMAEYVRRTRWQVLQQYESQTRGRAQDENSGISQEEDEPERNIDRESDEPEQQQQLETVIRRLLQHPSSSCNVTTREEEKQRLEEVAQFTSRTVRYGSTNLEDDPMNTLYQFDDALTEWMNKQGVFPWLRRLKTTEIVVV